MAMKPQKLIGKSIKRPTLSTSGTKKPIAKSGKPTTTNAAKTNLLKKKGRVDEGKALIKSGTGMERAAYKEMMKPLTAREGADAYNKADKGRSLQRMGNYVARKAAQPYGEAVRTNRRVQAQAKRKTK